MIVTELRVGNLVSYKRNDITTELKKVKGINYGGDSIFIEYYSQDGSQYPINKINFQPIQLTEEWAIKFGYECLIEMAICFSNESIYNIEITSADLIKLEVHEAQNLYFALTGEELEYNV